MSMSSAEPQRLRVLHLGSPAGLYGAERWILALARYLPAERVESFVAVIKDDPELEPPLCSAAAALGLHTHVFESHGRVSFSAIRQLRCFIREHGIDILHTHGYKPDILGGLAAAGTPCRTLVTPHGWSIKAGTKLRVYEALDRFCFLFADAVAPLSADLQRGLYWLPGLKRKLSLIENGVDLSEVDAPSDVSEPACSWRAQGSVVIGYIGQLITRKRVDILIRAFHQLDIPDKRLCVIGDGPQRGELESLAAELGESGRVSFLGFREDRVALLKGFDAFVLPSELEGIPRCLMEAMAARVPVVASNIPGCNDLVKNGVTGLLFPLGDVAALAEHLSRLLSDSAFRRSVVGAARDHIEQHRSAQRMAQQYLELYATLTGHDVVSPSSTLSSVDAASQPTEDQE